MKMIFSPNFHFKRFPFLSHTHYLSQTHTELDCSDPHTEPNSHDPHTDAPRSALDALDPLNNPSSDPLDAQNDPSSDPVDAPICTNALNAQNNALSSQSRSTLDAPWSTHSVHGEFSFSVSHSDPLILTIRSAHFSLIHPHFSNPLFFCFWPTTSFLRSTLSSLQFSLRPTQLRPTVMLLHYYYFYYYYI